MRPAPTALSVVGIAAILFAMAAFGAQPPARNAGESAYLRCYSCHSLERGDGGLEGPNLDRIVGRRIAAEPGFAYSSAFRRFAAREGRWTRALLDRFIADPEAVVPGNAMGFFGMADARQREALIAYIAADR